MRGSEVESDWRVKQQTFIDVRKGRDGYLGLPRNRVFIQIVEKSSRFSGTSRDGAGEVHCLIVLAALVDAWVGAVVVY